MVVCLIRPNSTDELVADLETSIEKKTCDSVPRASHQYAHNTLISRRLWGNPSEAGDKPKTLY